MKYAIIDIETTGLSPKNEKITEIAVFLHNGHQVVDFFSTLVNPEKKIPYRIVQLTGINNQMVQDAPKFYEIAKKIIEITCDNVIVGHNARFDYGFLRQEFLSLGYDFRRETIDTVKWARQLIPGQPSYSLGKLCIRLGIENKARHRATGDAEATVKLFELLKSLEPASAKNKNGRTNNSFNHSLTENLPHATGVYYFYNRSGELIYVGKSVDIHSRVMSHLNNNKDKRAVDMKNNLAEIDYTLTGSELVALLLESAEIKKRQPLYNRAQRRTYFNYGLYSFTDDNGYTNLRLNKIIDEVQPIYTYGSIREGQEHLYRLCKEFGLCQKLTGLYNTQDACFHYQIHQCNGACIGKEVSDDYNQRVKQAIENYHFDEQNFLIFGKGRNEEEKSIVKVENGKYIGFGFIPIALLNTKAYELEEFVQQQKDNKEVRRIIITAIKQGKAKKATPFREAGFSTT